MATKPCTQDKVKLSNTASYTYSWYYVSSEVIDRIPEKRVFLFGGLGKGDNSFAGPTYNKHLLKVHVYSNHENNNENNLI